jgi:hypothetical protein
MTKRFKLPLALILSALTLSIDANAQAAPNYVRPRNPNETPAPKVVFIGDTHTAVWPFPAGSNWIKEGVTGIMQGGLSSGGALAEFQSAVVSQHPTIVHIMVGANDAMIADDALYGGTTPVYMANITAMVKEAKAANIKVILGNIASTSVPAYSNLATEVMNAALDGYRAANGIQVINYSDALCGCQGSVGGTGIGTDYVTRRIRRQPSVRLSRSRAPICLFSRLGPPISSLYWTPHVGKTSRQDALRAAMRCRIRLRYFPIAAASWPAAIVARWNPLSIALSRRQSNQRYPIGDHDGKRSICKLGRRRRHVSVILKDVRGGSSDWSVRTQGHRLWSNSVGR